MSAIPETLTLEEAAEDADIGVVALLSAIGDGRLKTHRESRAGEVVDCLRRDDLRVLKDGATEAALRSSEAALWPGGRAAWGR